MPRNPTGGDLSQPDGGATGAGGGLPVPWQQFFLDDVFLLLLLGLAVPVVLYIIWGLMELSNLPVIQ